MLALTLLTGGVAACGSSGGSDKASDTTVAGSDTTAASGDSGGNSDVDAYCKAVDAFVTKYKAANGDPTKLGTLAADGQDLATKAGALASGGISADEAQKVNDCAKKASDALTGG